MPRKVTPRKLPSQDRARATVEALLQAASQVLQAEGSEGLTTNKIAERAGVSIGTLYQYFPNKESLVIDLITEHHEILRDAIRSDLERSHALPLPELVEQVMQSTIAVFRSNLSLSVNLEKLCLELGAQTDLEVLLEEIRAWTEDVLESRREELQLKDPELASFVVVRSVEGVLVGVAKARPELFESDALIPQLCALVLGYLAPGRAAEAVKPRIVASAV